MYVCILICYFRFEIDKPSRIWLVAPLIAKLPAAVQGKMLRAAGQVLESGSFWSSSSSSSTSSSSSSKNKDKDKQSHKTYVLINVIHYKLPMSKLNRIQKYLNFICLVSL